MGDRTVHCLHSVSRDFYLVYLHTGAVWFTAHVLRLCNQKESHSRASQQFREPTPFSIVALFSSCFRVMESRIFGDLCRLLCFGLSQPLLIRQSVSVCLCFLFVCVISVCLFVCVIGHCPFDHCVCVCVCVYVHLWTSTFPLCIIIINSTSSTFLVFA